MPDTEGIIPVTIEWPGREPYYVGFAEYAHNENTMTVTIDVSSIEGQTLTTLMDAGLAKMSISVIPTPIKASTRKR